MNTPPFLLGATLLFWGWQCGCLAVAAVLTVLVEGARWLPTRWDLDERDFDRLWNLCAVLFLGPAVYVWTSGNGPHVLGDWLQPPETDPSQPVGPERIVRASLAFIQWWPLPIFPFALAQAAARQPGVDWGTFFLFFRVRRATDSRPEAERRSLNLGFPYFALCLGCACIGQARPVVSFPILAILLLWAIGRGRPRRFALPTWAGVALLAVALGFAGEWGLRSLYVELQDYLPSWFLTDGRGGRGEARESRTSIGHIGTLKLSGKIVLRVHPRERTRPPDLLRAASYNRFQSPTWHAAGTGKEFQTLAPGAEESTFILRRHRPQDSAVEIAGYLAAGRGLLALPNGVSRLERLPGSALTVNPLGTVRVDSGPGFFTLTSWFGPGPGMDGPPTAEDREIPETERTAVEQVAGQLALGVMAPEVVLRTLRAFFADCFTYSLELGPVPRGRTNSTPLTRFLLQTRRGHCEHFATATVLLLRQAGIPARYATGFGVQEKAGSGYVVRERHAHAWCLAYLDGAWRDFDTTPASWSASDAARASMFEFLADLGSRLWFEFNTLRYGQTGLRRYLGWLVGFLLVLVTAQLFLGRRWRKARRECRSAVAPPPFPGLDSELYLIERALAGLGYPREPGENLTRWLERLGTVPAANAVRPMLVRLLERHYRYRFDPLGITTEEREALRAEARVCLARISRRSSVS